MNKRPDNVISRFSVTRRRVLSGLAGSVVLGTALPRALATSAPRTIDAGRLERAVARARGFDQLKALIIAVDGEVQFAEALRGPGLDRAVNVKSVAKTIVATLTGIALDRGILEDVDQPVLPLLGDHAPADADPRLNQLTVDHLLTMRAGLERTSGPNYGHWVASDHWVRFILSRPFVDEPGGRMLYSTGSYHLLLSAVLSLAAGRSLLDLARSGGYFGDLKSLSELFRRILGQARPRMPFDGPPYLGDEEIELIRSWIAQGAANAEGVDAPLPAGAKVRLHGTLESGHRLDGLELEIASRTRIDKNPGAGDYVQIRGRLDAGGRVIVERLRRR